MYKVDFKIIIEIINSLMCIINIENDKSLKNAEDDEMFRKLTQLHVYNSHCNEEIEFISEKFNGETRYVSITSKYIIRYNFDNINTTIKILLTSNNTEKYVYYIHPQNICKSSPDEYIILVNYNIFALPKSSPENTALNYRNLGSVIDLILTAFITDYNSKSRIINHALCELLLRYISKIRKDFPNIMTKLIISDECTISDLFDTTDKSQCKYISYMADKTVEKLINIKDGNQYLGTWCEQKIKYYVNNIIDREGV